MDKEKFAKWHDKNYKKLLLVPAILLIISLIFIFSFQSQNGEYFHKDISLTGGTSVTVYEQISPEKAISDLSSQLEDVNARAVYDILTNEQKAIIIETRSEGELTRPVLEDYFGYELNNENSSFEFTGSSLSKSFFKQLVIAIIVAFIFMAIVIFILFRSIIPSTAVIMSAFADITMTLAFIDVLGMKLSSAGIVALLMLIGYSVDTDILLTNRVLKRQEGTLNRRIFDSFKTGITMTLTSLFAVAFALIFVKSFSVVLSQIFTIVIIGLAFDLLNTWITNVSILKWYALKRK